MATRAAGVAAAAGLGSPRVCWAQSWAREGGGRGLPRTGPSAGWWGLPTISYTHDPPHPTPANARAPGRVKRPQPSGGSKVQGPWPGRRSSLGLGGTGLSAPRGARAGGAPHACPGRSGLTVPLARTSPDARAPRGARTSEQPAWAPRGLRPWRPRPWRGSSLTRAGASTARRLALRQPHDAGGVFAGTDLMGRSGAASR